MKSVMKSTAALLVLGLLAFGATRNADAAGTTAGTSITNQATLTYTVGTVSQTPIPSNIVTFKVDRKINVTVATTDTANVLVGPGAPVTLTFTVTNQGNDNQDFALSAIAEANTTASPWSGTADFQGPSPVVTVVGGGSNIINLAPDGAKTVTITFTVPVSQIDKDIAVFGLLATAKKPNTNAATAVDAQNVLGADGLYTVYADAQGSDDLARDAAHSARSACQVKSALLTITKSSTVISDLTNGTTNPRAIPGAIIEYKLLITNAGTATGIATNVAISDSLDTPIKAGSITFNTAYGINLQINTGAVTNLSSAKDGDAGDFNGTATNTVTVTGITLNPGDTATITYRVTIN